MRLCVQGKGWTLSSVMSTLHRLPVIDGSDELRPAVLTPICSLTVDTCDGFVNRITAGAALHMLYFLVKQRRKTVFNVMNHKQCVGFLSDQSFIVISSAPTELQCTDMFSVYGFVKIEHEEQFGGRAAAQVKALM